MFNFIIPLSVLTYCDCVHSFNDLWNRSMQHSILLKMIDKIYSTLFYHNSVPINIETDGTYVVNELF